MAKNGGEIDKQGNLNWSSLGARMRTLMANTFSLVGIKSEVNTLELPFQPDADPIEKSFHQARLLMEFGLNSKKSITTEVRNMQALGLHLYNLHENSDSNKQMLMTPEELLQIDGVPSFFPKLAVGEQAKYCFDYVTNELSVQFHPVSFETLIATKRKDMRKPWSSYAAKFTRKVIRWSLIFVLIFVAYHYVLTFQTENLPEGFLRMLAFMHARQAAFAAVLFGCMGSLTHLLNQVMRVNRTRTFELHETRLIGPRLILGGIFGVFVALILGNLDVIQESELAQIGTNGIAFIAGYSVKFSIGLLDRLIGAVFPESR